MATKKARSMYVDGFVFVVAKKKVAAYRKMAQEAGAMWLKNGALEYRECIGDDLKPNDASMPTLTFPQMAKAKPGETVWFSYITYTSRKHRDQVNTKVNKQMEKLYGKQNKKDMEKSMPFDMRRMAYGGFKVEVYY